MAPRGQAKARRRSHLVETRGMVQLSTGDMLREAKTAGTEMGQKVAEIMDAGKLVTDEIVIGLIEEKLMTEKVRRLSSLTASRARWRRRMPWRLC